ncbi:MAG TPA: TROVE domain-containing protein [Allosphingosinicella sp.]|nr:TROVE domain-containing protein [Allosphingosinicella sp.]
MRLNIARLFRPRTFEDAPAVAPRSDLAALRRTVASCLLWEDQFYEDGIAIGDRIAELAARVDPAAVAALAVEARTDMRLRHAPLWLLVALMKADTAGKVDVAATVAETIRRADEMGELIALYWKDGRRPLPAAMKRGLARAFARFDAYQLAKYDRKTAVTLKDVLRLTHPKPADEAQAAMWKQVVEGSLESPDTWEVALSGGADKKETFERLLRENRLGYLALLRNLRNMAESGVDPALVTAAILARRGAHHVLPFRYVAAARAAPQFEPALDEALSAAVEAMPVLGGRTIVLVDVSGSMDCPLSRRSDLSRLDAAAALASIVHGQVRVFTFSEEVVEVPPRRGMAGVDAVTRSQPHSGTYLGAAVRHVNALPHDRLIVITDEQSHDAVGAAAARQAYMINVASARNGVGYGPWTRIDGFSENVLRFIHAHEADDR